MFHRRSPSTNSTGTSAASSADLKTNIRKYHGKSQILSTSGFLFYVYYMSNTYIYIYCPDVIYNIIPIYLDLEELDIVWSKNTTQKRCSGFGRMLKEFLGFYQLNLGHITIITIRVWHDPVRKIGDLQPMRTAKNQCYLHEISSHCIWCQKTTIKHSLR